MNSKVIVYDEETTQELSQVHYDLPPKKALIAYVCQFIEKNNNTWNYPDDMEEIRQRAKRKAGLLPPDA